MRCPIRDLPISGSPIFQPSGRAEAPRANLSPRRIRRLNCVIPRPDEWAYPMNFPNKDDFAIKTDVYLGGAYFRLCFVDVVRAADLKATSRRLGGRFIFDGTLYRSRAALPNTVGISGPELESPCPVGQIHPSNGYPN